MRVLVMSLFLAACGDRGPQPTSGGEPTTVAGDAPAAAPALHGVRPDAPVPLPEFRAVAQDGTSRGRADLVGKPTVVWFYPAANTPG